MGFTIDANDSTFVLDPAIRNWVIFPIFVVMILVSLAKSWFATILQFKKRPDLEKLQEGQVIMRSQRLCNGSTLLPYFSFNARRSQMTKKTLNLDKPKDAQQGNPLMNPDQGGVMDIMRQQVTGYLPQFIIMGWVSYFFSGFIVVKLPFFLTPRFKSMLQSGMEFAGLDFCYVSSISWYFLCLLGLRGLTSVFLEWAAPSLNANPTDGMAMMPAQLNVRNGMPADIVKNFKAEADNLNIINHTWELEDVEARLMGKAYKPKDAVAAASGKSSSSSTVVTALNTPAGSSSSTTTAATVAAVAAQKKLKKRKVN